MAIPENRLSSLHITDFYIAPDDRETFALLDYEQGGIGLNDPSQGLNIIPWTLRYFPATGDMVIESETTAPTILFTRSGITEISLAWDQNMNPFVAFVENGDAKFWWYDSEIATTVFTNLPANSLTPRCCLDDKRQSLTGDSDIILCYVLNGDLKMRMQRDRYEVQYTLQSPFLHPQFDLPAVIKKVGMNKKNRLQWLCDLASPLDWCNYKAEA